MIPTFAAHLLRKTAPVRVKCPKCGGSGEIQVGCAIFKPIMWSCAPCLGRGTVPLEWTKECENCHGDWPTCVACCEGRVLIEPIPYDKAAP